MKFKEYYKLICEVTVEQVKTRFESKAWKRAIEQLFKYLDYKKDFDDLDDTVRMALYSDFLPNDIDENSKGNALNWLVSIFIKDPTFISRFHSQSNRVRSSLELFYQIKQVRPVALSVKAIEQIADINDLYTAVGHAKPVYDEYLQNRAEKDTKTDINNSKVLETAEWNVYVPKTKGAAIQLGKGTDWCTAAPGLQYYEHYTQTGPLVIFISKQNPELKYQFWYNGTESQFMNARDEDILYGEESETFFQLNELVKQFADKFPQLSESNNYEYKLLENGGYMLRIPNKTVYFDKNKELHKEDGPARLIRIRDEEVEEYYVSGKLHRDDGPARITKTNDIVQEEWFLNGIPKRLDNKPESITYRLYDGSIQQGNRVETYKDTDGKYHKDGGPAHIRYDADKVTSMYWYKHGTPHRLDGPAIIHSNGYSNYYINGIQFVSKEEFYDEKARERKLHNYF